MSNSPQKTKQTETFFIGLAMFSMFFGSGNVVFPLAIGKMAQNDYFYGILGLILTAVVIPFAGVISIILFNGNYKKFFLRMGRIPALCTSLLIMMLIGPFGVVPRCVTISYSTFKTMFPSLTLLPFSIIACIIILLLTIKKSKVIDILGKFLTPILLLSLATIIIVGLFFTPQSTEIVSQAKDGIFLEGLVTGYQTMDLLASFFFSSIIVLKLKNDQHQQNLSHRQKQKNILKRSIMASSVGGLLLAIVYSTMGYLTAKHSSLLTSFSNDELLGKVAIIILGKQASIFANLVATLATLTTAIALTSVFSEYISKTFFSHNSSIKEKHITCLSILITLVLSNFNFSGIMMVLGPAVNMIYPALIVLTFCNLLHKLCDFKIVKTPVYLTFALTVAHYIYHSF